MKKIINNLISGDEDYDNLINLRDHRLKLGVLDSSWNDFDNLNKDTIFLHTTQKVTQPWRKGLPLNSYPTNSWLYKARSYLQNLGK